MTASHDISEFLASRRAKITPEQVGLPSFGQRRVPGLRREKVASLAGVSADYYRRLERGQVSGVSELVLEAIARALQLDEAERTHLFDLAHADYLAANPLGRALYAPVRGWSWAGRLRGRGPAGQQVELGICAIPKSVKAHRIAENFDIFDFALTADEIAAIDALDRGVPDPEQLSPETYPKVVDNS